MPTNLLNVFFLPSYILIHSSSSFLQLWSSTEKMAMASSIRQRALVYKLRSKLGSMKIFHQHNYMGSSMTHQICPSFSEQMLTNPDVISTTLALATHFVSRHHKSTVAQKKDLHSSSCGSNESDQISLANGQTLDFPGGKVGLTSQMRFISETNSSRVQCYRVLDNNGQLCGKCTEVGEELAAKMYKNMVTLRAMDTVFYEAQRQGRISFYATSTGEEAIHIASAAALSIDDLIVPQYREQGVLLWRGFPLQDFANQCFSNKDDYGKGRQMTVHYGSNKLNYLTVAATVATQIPHAVGAAYSLKMDDKDACTVAYFGDGGTSTGDFHAALNFAAVLEVPILFFCRNNGWAISTPVSDQMRSDGVVVRGQAYGIRSIRIDGNDALAIYNAVHEARRIAVTEKRPVLIEALTYRAGHHSTSDDSTRYRSVEEIELWRKERDPLTRFRKWIERNGWWNDEMDSELQSSVREQLMHAIQVAEKLEKPSVADLFTDVYNVLSPNLCEQERSLRETIKAHPEDYPSNVPV